MWCYFWGTQTKTDKEILDFAIFVAGLFFANPREWEGALPRSSRGFAVNALIRWYRAGVDVQIKLPLLATWLGHVSIFSTYHYLHFVEDLRLAANSRFIDSYGSVVVPVPKNGVSR